MLDKGRFWAKLPDQKHDQDDYIHVASDWGGSALEILLGDLFLASANRVQVQFTHWQSVDFDWGYAVVLF